MLTRSQILDDIHQAIRRANELREPDAQIPFAEETRLYGREGYLDSLGLVSLLLDLEQSLGDKLGASLSFSDERAMSQSRNPFRTVHSLADYIEATLRELGTPCPTPSC